MKRIKSWFFGLLVVMTFIACSGDNGPLKEPPSLLVDSERQERVVSNLPGGGNGNFEALVADFERKDRGIWQKPDLVISLLGDLSDKVVADIGAGTGYFTFRLVPRAERVIGIDIDPRFIKFMDSVRVRLPAIYQERFESRLALKDDPLLRAREADAVMVVNTYGYLSDRLTYFRKVNLGMQTEGVLLVIDFKKNNLSVGPPDEYRVGVEQVKRELINAGFKIMRVDIESLDYQYIILATKP
jgi:SAM-dependent methyltransferase